MNGYGNRTRQAVSLALLEYVADDLIDARQRQSSAQKRRAMKSRASGKGKKKNAREKRKPVARSRRATASRRSAGEAVIFDGEDLMAIAARELGDVRRWREIADLNGIRDPRAVTIGQVLRLP